MDWKKTFNRGQWVIHGIFLLAVILGMGLMLFALRMKYLQTTEEERVVKINSLVQFLKEDQSFEKIGKFLSWAESDKANDKIRELTHKVAQTEELLEVRATSDVGLSLRTFNRLISDTSGMSHPADALKVLKQKTKSLYELAKSQHYNTVAGTTERMMSRLDQLHAKNAGGSVQISYLSSDLKKLEQVVSASSLTEGEKKALNSRFASMKNELGLLQSLNSQSRDLHAHVTQATLGLATWMIDVEKKASDVQGLRLQKQNQLILFLAGLVGFLALAWMGLAYLFRWQKVKLGEQVEAEVKNVIEKGILGDERFMLDHYSEPTQRDVVRLLDELKIKLSLGSMLHEGLPFAGCMIDNNFKLTWHNHLFLEQLYLSQEEVESDAFNWDYVRDYLNLNEDPIYEALVNKIAGIYSVKVKQDELTPTQPYEMYVTPITVNREDRVMVFFYPLVSVKEAIEEQVDLSRQSMRRFINLWNEEKLDQDEMKLLEKDFMNNDLSELFGQLSQIYSRVNDEKAECLKVIQTLESENQDFAELMSEMSRIDSESQQLIRDEVKIAHDIRTSFVQTLERSETLIHINRSVMQQNDELRNEALKLQHHSQDMVKKTNETLDILGQLESVRIDYKKLKLELLEVKAKLISINSTLFGQLPPFDEPQQKLATRYKDELARLDFNVTTLDKKLSQLDVLLVKLHMMNEKHTPFQTMFNLHTTQKDHELKEAILEVQKSLNQEESKIIDQFKHLHHLMKENLRTVSHSRELSQNHLSQ